MNATDKRAFSRVCRLGESAHVGSTFVKIEYRDGKLSISGVEGPKANGDARGGGGQIVMSGFDIEQYAPGWDRESVAKLADIWNAWHLNDMRAGCEHQRAEHWGEEDIEVVTYRLTSEALREKGQIKRAADDSLAKTGEAKITEEERLILSLPYTRTSAPDSEGVESGRYEVEKRETKRANWVHPEEHSRGVLGKACPVCGYKYGTRWLSEAVPADVLDWLEALPETDRTPAWV
jgi:hypothetical protein